MNPEKIGNFISTLRKEKGYTQLELAQQLGVTDKAVSKWERGLCFPDMSLLIPISEIFDITINELLLGKRTTEENKEVVEDINKDILEYSSNEIKKTKKREKKLKIVFIIVSILFLIFLFFMMINAYRSEKEKKELERYQNHIETNLKDLHFKKDNPLHSPNYILTIDEVTYVVPKYSYNQFWKNKIYKEILSYSDYDTFSGLILYFNGKEISVHKTVGEENEMISIKCDARGDLIKKEITEEEEEFYKSNKEEIKDRAYQIFMMWNNIFKY